MDFPSSTKAISSGVSGDGERCVYQFANSVDAQAFYIQAHDNGYDVTLYSSSTDATYQVTVFATNSIAADVSDFENADYFGSKPE